MDIPEPSTPLERWCGALASLTVGLAFFSLWFWLLPQWLGFRVGAARWRWLGVVPSVLGFAVALRCFWDFGWTGHGTPAPVAPPKRLVVVGPYRYVRNPMYLGFAVGWIGLWVVFGHPNPVAIGAVAAAALSVHLFVVFYEEPTLRNKFGQSTKSIAAMCVAGGLVLEHGNNGNSTGLPLVGGDYQADG